METEDSKMNLYTTDEVNMLLKSIAYVYIGFKNIILNNKVTINYDLFLFFIFTDPNLDPFALVPQSRTITEESERRILRDIRKLIYEEPIYRVPLYINIYPEIASWRLELGK
jgi:hypothetical protein